MLSPPVKLKADSFVSCIFTTMKPDGSHRTRSITYEHFKMESLQNVRQLIKPDVCVGSIDLRDAYYSVRVNPHFQQYFTCYWKGCYSEFLRMPFGFLQKHGYASVA